MKQNIKIFISSTYKDLKTQRAILQKFVFPEVKEYAQKLDINILPIDLKWEENINPDMLKKIIKDEKHLLTQPNSLFLMLVGNNYGNIPIPQFIEKDEFELILSQLSNEEKEFLTKVYKLDYNHIPVSYALIDKNNEQIVEIINKAIKKINIDKSKYTKSFLEIEFEEFIEHTPSKKQILAVITNSEKRDNKLQSLINKVKDSLPLSHIKYIDNKEIDISKIETIEKLPPNLRGFAENIIDFINSYVKKIAQENIKEQEYHIDFKYSLLKNRLIGRETELKKAIAILKDENRLLISGPSGIGKSVFIANLIELLKHKNLIYRFTGITTESSDIFLLLESIIKEAGFEIKSRFIDSSASSTEKLSQTKEFFKEIKEKLEEIKDETFIIIDAIEQTNQAELDTLEWLPNNPKVKIVISAINDPNYEIDSLYYQKFIAHRFNNIKLQNFNKNEYKEALIELLKDENRTLSTKQIKQIEPIFDKINSMIFIKMAKEITKYWHSFDEKVYLPDTNKAIIKEFFAQLYKKYLFSEELIKTFLSYIIISKESLTENILIEIFNQNEKILNQIKNRLYFESKDKLFPLGLWGRLKIYLDEIITTNNKNVIKFSHREYKKGVDDFVTIEKAKELSNYLEKIHIDERTLFSHIQVNAYLKTVLPDFKVNVKFFDKLTYYHIEYYLSMLIKLTFRTNKSIKAYCIMCYEISEYLYKKDPHKWMIYYIKSLNAMSSMEIEEENLDKAQKYLQKAYKELKKLDEYNIERYIKDYTSSLNKMLNFYLAIDDSSFIKTIYIDTIELLRELYKENPEKWTKFYLDTLLILEKIEYSTGTINKAKELCKEDLIIIKNAYNKNPKKWAKEYTQTLINLAKLHYTTGDIFEIEKSCKEAKKEIEKLIPKDPKYYIPIFIDGLLEINKLFFEIGDLEKIENNIKEAENILSKYKEIKKEQLYIKIISAKIELQLIKNPKQIIDLIEEKEKLLQNLIKTDIKWIRTFSKELTKDGWILMKIGEVDKAYEIFQKNVTETKKAYDKNQLYYIHTYSKALETLEEFFYKTNQLSKAKEIYQKNIDLYQKAYAKSNEKWINDYIISLINLGKLYGKIGNIQKCEILFKDAKNILENHYYQNREKWAKLYFDNQTLLAKSLVDAGKIEEAKEIYKQLAEEMEDLYKQDHFKWMPLYSASLMNIAELKFKTGDIEKAKKIYEQIIDIKTTTYNIKPEQWIESYSITIVNMADLLYQQGKTQEAEKLYNENIELLKEAYEDNPERWIKLYTTSMNNLANLYIVSDKKEKAEKAYNNILEILNEAYEKTGGKFIEEYTTALNNVATFYEQRGKIHIAEPLALEAIEVLRKAYKDNPQRWTEPYLEYIESLSELYAAIEAFENSKTLNNERLQILKEAYETNPEKWLEKYIVNLNNTAYLNEISNNKEEAEKMYKETVNILKPLYEEKPSKYAQAYISALTNLAHLYETENRIEEAEYLYNQALSIIKTEFNKDHKKYLEDFVSVLERLATCYEKQNKIKEAIKTYEELVSLTKAYQSKSNTCKNIYNESSKKVAYLMNKKIKNQIK